MGVEEAVYDLEALTPMGVWGETGWMVVGRMRLAVPRQTDWTASGALDWDFLHSTEVDKAERGGGG